MKKKRLKKLISGLPEKKRKSINKKLSKIGSLINNVEVDLIDTKLEDWSLMPDKKAFTVWCHFYQLERMFE